MATSVEASRPTPGAPAADREARGPRPNSTGKLGGR